MPWIVIPSEFNKVGADYYYYYYYAAFNVPWISHEDDESQVQVLMVHNYLLAEMKLNFHSVFYKLF